MQLCFTGQLLFICHSVITYLQQYTEFQEKKNIRTNSVNVRKFGHVTHGVFHVYYRWTDVIC